MPGNPVDKGSGSLFLGGHVRRLTITAAGGGAGQMTIADGPEVRGGYYWRLLGIGISHDSATNQACRAFMLPAGMANTTLAPIMLIEAVDDEQIQSHFTFGGPTKAVVPQGWRVHLSCHDMSAGDTLTGSIAYLELELGDHCYV